MNVAFHGRLRGMTSRRTAQLVEAAGGRCARRASGADVVVVGHASVARCVTDEFELRLGFEPRAGAALVSEDTFRRLAGIGPGLPAETRAYPADQLAALARLAEGQVRLLALYDVLTPAEGLFGYRDLLTARAVARLLAKGIRPAKLVAAAHALAARGATLAATDLTQGPWGDVGEEVGGRFATLDGQFVLPLGTEEIDPDEAFSLGEASEAEGDLEAAERWYRLAARGDRTDAVIPFNLGNVLDAAGRSNEAEDAYREAVRRDPLLADAWFNLAILDERRGRFEEALAGYRTAAASDPRYPDAIHNAAALLMRLHRFEDALTWWERLAEVSPAHTRAARRFALLCRLELGVGRSTA